ncbi:MAG: hypothetical protein ACRD3N_17310 [Terracidiphilus sp.]
MKKPVSSLILTFALGITTATLFAQADGNGAVQTPPKRMIFGQYDQAFTFPRMVGVPGQKDSVALNAVQLYLGASSHGEWPGFDATGIMVVGTGEQKSEIPATLTIEPGGLYRLDLTTPYGIRSERVEGATGAMRSEDGKTVPLPALAVASGIIPLPSTLADAATDARDSLIDGGTVEVEGARLHKITFIRPLFPESGNSQPPAPPLITDFFFDSTSHLLIKSVDAVLLSPNSAAHHLRVIAYDDYRPVSGIIIPFRYTETVDGRLAWSLQFTNVTAGSNHGAEYFRF